MKAVDTNIIARYVVGDDPEQARLATAILAGPCYLSDTVLLETAWLLSSRYGVDRADLAAILADLIRLPAMVVSNFELVEWAIARFLAGADFADMMHLVSSRGSDAFVSFDRRLADLAGSGAPLPIERPR